MAPLVSVRCHKHLLKDLKTIVDLHAWIHTFCKALRTLTTNLTLFSILLQTIKEPFSVIEIDYDGFRVTHDP